MALSDREKDIIRAALAALAEARLHVYNSQRKDEEAERHLTQAYNDLRRLLKEHEEA